MFFANHSYSELKFLSTDMNLNRLRIKLQLVLNLLTGKLVFESANYRESELSRLMNLFAHEDLRSWKGMKVLEVGAGLGHIGEIFRALGFDVTSTDGRANYVERMRKRGREALVLDLDRTPVHEVGHFDLILAFGVLYHLSEPQQFLSSCEGASVLLLETIVCDTSDSTLLKVAEPKGVRGQDQALNVYGCRPSPSWVEAECRAAGFGNVRDISTSLANWPTGSYDWEPRNDRSWRRDGVNLRKMWVADQSTEKGLRP